MLASRGNRPEVARTASDAYILCPPEPALGGGNTMQKAKEDIPVVMQTDGAVVRQQTDFGAATDYGELASEYIHFAAGTDLTPLLAGLPDDMCQCPHWGYVLEGALNLRYSDGTEEVDRAGDLFYWPPGHTLWVDEDTEFVLFSPQDDHVEVFEHMADRMAELPE
jgi:hypothetical protein